MHEQVPLAIQHEIDNENFKREMVQRLRTTGDELRQGVAKLHRHQQTLARTLLHGDTHLGNIYLLPDGRAGLLDWHLVVRGHHMHDRSEGHTSELTSLMRYSYSVSCLKKKN